MAILGLLGLLLLVVGWVWLMIIAFKSGGALWTVLIFFFSWIAGLIFCFVKKEDAIAYLQLRLSYFGSASFFICRADRGRWIRLRDLSARCSSF